MNGRPRPRRTPARPDLPPSRRRRITSLLSVLALLLVLAAGLFAAGCGSEATETSTTAAAGGTFPITVTDDNGNSVTIAAQPMRIVSAAPASTEILFALGLGDKVVGVTTFCDYPAEAAAISKVGDFQTNTEAVMALSPDLVIGYAGSEEALAPVQAAGAAVIILNPPSLEGIYNNITTIGAATGKTAEAAALVESLRAQIAAVTEKTSALSSAPKVFYAVDNTLWTAGPGSFVDELLKLVNAVNVGSMTSPGSPAAQAYYQFAPEQLIAADPDVILLPNTAYQSVEEFTGDPRFAQLRAVTEGKVFLVNDVIITRPGPRIGEGLEALAKAVHPDMP